MVLQLIADWLQRLFWVEMIILRLALLFVLSMGSAASAQEQGPVIGTLMPDTGWRPETFMVAAFISLGFVVVVMQFLLFFRAREYTAASDITRGFVTTLVVISVVALVGLGYTASQIQPAIALFGTIIGYVVGRESRGTTGASSRRHGEANPPQETQTTGLTHP